MQHRSLQLCLLVFSALGLTCASPAFAQGQTPTRPSEDIIRVETSIVQTDVMVFDKQGGFIDNLKRDQFQLKVDGKPREVLFFERITAGSRTEEAQIAAARGVPSRSLSAAGSKGPVPLDRGRTIFFFIDDLHLSASSVKQTRSLLSRFITREMGQNDEAAIISATGQIGFLQQLTDNKLVLRTAAERLNYRPYTVRDADSPPMSEYHAILIQRDDDDTLGFFVDELVKQNPDLPRGAAADMVRGRASQMLHQAASITTNTLISLQGLIKGLAGLPGRKIVFLVSDGFFLDNRNSDVYERMRRITSAAAVAGVIIYSVDARGLATGMPDASGATTVDPSARLARSGGGEMMASQDGLSALAGDTGGRAFFASNSLSASVTTALKDSSVYYLLAWRPEPEEQRNDKPRRIEVTVPGRSDLVVRFRRGFGNAGASATTTTPSRKTPAPTVRKPSEELHSALRSAYPRNELPVSVSLNFVDVPRTGSTLTTSMKVATNSVVFESQGGSPTAIFDIGGVIIDAKGKVVDSFQKRLTLKATSADSATSPPPSISYNHSSELKPGIYQARVAAVDQKQGQAGSAMQWIEIPDLTSRTLTLSSLIVGERRMGLESQAAKPGEMPAPLTQLNLNVDHRFARSSRLRFLTFVYNASTNFAGMPNTVPSGSETKPNPVPANDPGTKSITGAPDLAVQVQVFRDNEPVITTPIHQISTEGLSDMSRLPYAAEVRIEELQPGRYVLQVTVIDRLAKASASQRFSFEVD